MDSSAGLAGRATLPELSASPRTGTDTGAPSGSALAAGFRVIKDGLAMAPTVSVVIPAKNEARNLAHALASIPSWVDEVVLVDGHSIDDTVAEARRLMPGIRIVPQCGSGKGNALREGLSAATGDIIVMLDADGSTDGREIPRFVSALVAGADFVKGSRFACGGGSDDITLTRRLGNRILSALVNLLFGTRYTDLCYGYNAFWAHHLAVLDLDCDGFEVETVMNIRAAKAGLRVHEVPSHEHSRVHGESHLHVIRDGSRIARLIASEWLSARGRKLPTRASTLLAPCLAAIAGALILIGAYQAAVHPGTAGWRYTLYWTGMLIALLPTAIRLIRGGLTRRQQCLLMVLLGLITYIPKLCRAPSYAVFVDEQLHLYQEIRIIETGSPFVVNPILAELAHYPGFDVLVVAVHFTGIPLWPSGLLVVGVAHIALLFGVALLVLELTGDQRIAAASAIIYAVGPAYTTVTVEAAYESAGLPLAVWALAMAFRAARSPSWRIGRLSLAAAAFLIALTGVTHPLSSAILLVWLLAFAIGSAIAVMRRGARGLTPGTLVFPGLVAFAVTFDVAWAVMQRYNPLPYLLPADVSILPGTYAPDHSPFQHSGLPPYEVTSGWLAPVIVTGLVALGVLAGRYYFLDHPEWRWVLAAVFLLYPMTFLAALNQSAGAEVHRAWPYLYATMVPLAAIGVADVVARPANVKKHVRQLVLRNRIGRPSRFAILLIVVAVLAMGNTANDATDADCFPGPWVAGTSRTLTPELLAADQWLRGHASINVRVLADMTTSYELEAYAQAAPVTDIGTWALTETTARVPVEALIDIYAEGIDFIIVDERMATSLNGRGYWYSSYEPGAFHELRPFPPAAVNKLETQPWVVQVYASRHIRIYKVRRPVLANIVNDGAVG